MIAEGEGENFENFKDCLSTIVIQKLAPAASGKQKKVKGRKNEIKPVVKESARLERKEDGEDVAELADFVEVG